MRRLLVTLVVLAVLAVVADRVAVVVVERVLATRAQSSAELSRPPDVAVEGFPFLTQALAGRYRDVRVSAGDETVAGVRVSAFTARLRGVRVPLGDAVRGAVASVPVDGLSGSVRLSYAELSRLAPRGLTVSAAGPQVRVRGSVQVLGRTVSAAAVSDVRLVDGRLRVRAQRFETGSGLADDLLSSALGDRFDFDVPLGRLPYGLRASGLAVHPDGVVLSATAGPTVLRP